MTYTLEEWKTSLSNRLQQSKDWLAKVKAEGTPYLLYGSLCGMSLWPLVARAQETGQLLPVALTLGSVVGGVGANLVAEQIQRWIDAKDGATEEDVIEWAKENAATNADLTGALNTILEKLDAIPQAATGLSEADRAWLSQTLSRELDQLGALGRFEATLSGAGLIIQGSNLQGGPGSVVGSSAGGHIITGSDNVVNIGTSSGPEPSDLQTDYLNGLFEACGALSLSGVDKAAAREAEADLNLSAVYTALLTLSTQSEEGRRAEQLLERAEGRLPALAQLDRHKYLVLLGGPGSGKSAFVNFVTMCLAGERLGRKRANLEQLTAPLPDDEGQDQEERQPWLQGWLLPVRVILRDFAARGLPPVGQAATADDLWQHIATELEALTLGDYVPHLEAHLRQYGGLLLLDGLDEVPEAGERRTQIKQAVEAFRGAFSRCRILVTSRTYAYQRQDWRLKNFEQAVLAPFSQGQIRRFVDRWYAHIAALRGLQADDAQGRADLLKRAISTNERLNELAERPLLLTLMASLHAWRGGSLPDRREELYNDAVDLLLDWWERPKVIRAGGQVIVQQPSLAEWLKADKGKVRQFLNQLAYDAHASQPRPEGTADIDEDSLVGGLMRLSDDPAALNPAQLVSYLSQRAGLLLPRGVGVYTFPHRTFQEYLAACHLTDAGYPDEVAYLARTAPQRWREVALLAGAKVARGGAFGVWPLVDALCDRPLDPGTAEEPDWWGAHLAGQFLTETADLGQLSRANAEKVARVIEWLCHLVRQSSFPATERVLAGQALANLGDPRPGVGLNPDGLPDIVWCEVPAGSFLMGTAKASADVWDGTPQKSVDLDGFQISKYPITNAQYTAFVKDGGYTQTWRRCWTKVGWDWKERLGRTGPDRYGSPFDLPNHPVVGVSWYEALAFCNWLTLKLREGGKLATAQRLILPTESQWEKAAQGPDGQTYPWGQDPDPNRANYGDTGIGATSAVGLFPAGVSPYGVEEMSGNVWEWCLTKWEEDYRDYRDDNDLEGDARRVVRGGAFYGYLPRSSVRCAARSRHSPHYRLNAVGFRVLVSPIPSSAL
jgi:formylglycine-generating enzyme required for sulfatase activity/predicted ATPase